MAQGKNAQLEGGRELVNITQKDSFAGSLFQRIIDTVNQLATNAGVGAVGKLPHPDPVDTIDIQGAQSGDTVTCPSEILHFTLTHNQALQKGVHYFSEVDTDPNFSSPHVIHHGTSRSAFQTLPAQDNDGNPHTYYLRSYAQYPGSDPSPITVFGGKTGATKIVMTGASKTSLLQSKGSGTASPTGQQGGKGFGTVLFRPAPGPKRNVK